MGTLKITFSGVLSTFPKHEVIGISEYYKPGEGWQEFAFMSESEDWVKEKLAFLIQEEGAEAFVLALRSEEKHTKLVFPTFKTSELFWNKTKSDE